MHMNPLGHFSKRETLKEAPISAILAKIEV